MITFCKHLRGANSTYQSHNTDYPDISLKQKNKKHIWNLTDNKIKENNIMNTRQHEMLYGK